MSEVYVSIGSNVDREANIKKAVRALRKIFGSLSLSPVYESASVGFVGDEFLNLVAGIETDRPVEQIVASFRQIEDDLGRDRSQPRYSPRAIDLDILIYDNLIMDESGIQIPRREILKNAFVLKPLQDLIPDYRHPLDGQSCRELWLAMAPTAPRLDVFELALD
ncbi:MAG: 2-amino-4-hydroxy-6-hydroxymethyldihydropteridine diphosphokinase [Gammaproteobacteria bacterium]|nr:2-amino-4-hydroxy-6-hydroxymethyldihydropteridine diphosphokinase [Gammaproteobacteria bacterium]